MLDTNASDEQILSILLPELPEKLKRPIAYWWRFFNRAEQAYNKTQREFPAVVLAAQNAQIEF